MMTVKVLICGGRDFTDWEYFRDKMHELCEERKWWAETEDDPYYRFSIDVEVIHGGAKGADSLADQWAVLNYLPFYEFKADWDKYGKAAGLIRNQQILDEGKPDVVVAFKGGRGTAHMKRIARAAGVEVIEF
jgi:SLOG family YspA-like protein